MITNIDKQTHDGGQSDPETLKTGMDPNKIPKMSENIDRAKPDEVPDTFPEEEEDIQPDEAGRQDEPEIDGENSDSEIETDEDEDNEIPDVDEDEEEEKVL